ncbi:hypothetical protein R3P38DRAFT_3438887 [Favolaschia claudopus]|uniref:C2H2-type domain-containing protein n=1 Tax=Favolaschia claudopus TaxID=2862362 RepID=A0AAV9ZR23_9AGAR
MHSPSSKRRPKYDLILSESPRGAKDCRGFVGSAACCPQCSELSLDISIIKERASRSFEHVHDHDDLSVTQLRAKVKSVKETLNELKLKSLDLAESADRAHKRLDEHADVMQFLGDNAYRIPAIHRLLCNASANGWSPTRTLQHCKLAYEVDLAVLLSELGGGGAVYALNHSIFTLPSRNTIRPYRREANLMPSINGVGAAEISRNIAALFGPRESHSDQASRVEEEDDPYGFSLSFDEVAAERRIDYFPETDEMGGFCLEHRAALDSIKVGTNTQTVEAAVTAVREGKVHISHEISVGAISRLSETGYGAKPVFMGPSCKIGTWRDCLRTMEIVLECWKRSKHGEQLHGPILSVSSDGCPKRRYAMFMMCMHSEILPGNPLYPFICDLPGLNRRVGKDNLTNDPDYKHEFKRLRTLVCSPEGLVVKNVCINRDLLTSWLERLPNHDWSETSLYALLNPADAQHIKSLDSDDFDPSEAAEFEALWLLADFIDAWLQPFINVELNLSQQIESLITAPHLLCALYLQNGPSFMPNQLYADIQASIKNAVLLVPKTRIINGKRKVFICLLGDDVLEALFGRSRMIGGHSPNSSVGELRDRFVSAMNLDYIYEQHPEWERQPQRLNMFRMRHNSGLSCDLKSCWTAAVHKAEAILAQYRASMAVPFAVLFQRKDTDLLRPFGGKYPAISTDVDRSMVGTTSTPAESIAGLDPETINPPNMMTSENLDNLFASVTPPDITPHSLFADVNDNGRQAHKKTIIRTFFDMTHDSHSSHDRLQRVRGYTIGGRSWARESTADTNLTVSSATHFKLGDLFTTLISHNNTHLALAIAKSTVIKKMQPGAKPVSMPVIPRAELPLAESPYIISGQVLSLVPIPYNGTPFACAWDGKFVTSKPTAMKPPGSATCSFRSQAALLITISTMQLAAGVPLTWLFPSANLLSAWNYLWNQLMGDETLHNKFPIFTSVCDGVFPYTTSPTPDSPGLCYSLPIQGTAIEESHRNRSTCRVCGLVIKETDRQQHIGRHILQSVLGVRDPTVKVPVSKEYPCGTCAGPTDDGNCKMGIKSGKLNSECPSAYSFMVNRAGEFRDKRPCTNIPIKCPLGCDQTHWKYNFLRHLDERHPQWTKVSSAEQAGLEIPENLVIEWPPVLPSSDSPTTVSQDSSSRKRPISPGPQSPSRRSNKENEAPPEEGGNSRTKKKTRII